LDGCLGVCMDVWMDVWWLLRRANLMHTAQNNLMQISGNLMHKIIWCKRYAINLLKLANLFLKLFYFLVFFTKQLTII
jgi:hypothetical protein